MHETIELLNKQIYINTYFNELMLRPIAKINKICNLQDELPVLLTTNIP